MTEFHDVVAYSDVYGFHPSTIVATLNGFKIVSSRADPFTGKLGEIMVARQRKISPTTDTKRIALHRKIVLSNQSLQFSHDLSDVLRKSGVHRLHQSDDDISSQHNSAICFPHIRAIEVKPRTQKGKWLLLILLDKAIIGAAQ